MAQIVALSVLAEVGLTQGGRGLRVFTVENACYNQHDYRHNVGDERQQFHLRKTDTSDVRRKDVQSAEHNGACHGQNRTPQRKDDQRNAQPAERLNGGHVFTSINRLLFNCEASARIHTRSASPLEI